METLFPIMAVYGQDGLMTRKFQKAGHEMKSPSRDQEYTAKALRTVTFVRVTKARLVFHYYSALILSNSSKWSLHLGRAEI